MALVILIDGLEREGDPPLKSLCPTLARWAAVGWSGRVALSLAPAPAPFPATTGTDAPAGGAGGPPHLPLLAARGPAEREHWFQLLGQAHQPLERDLPAGWIAAYGMGLEPHPEHTWCRVGFTHLMQKRDKLLFLSPQRTGQSPAERDALGRALGEALAADGWTHHGGPHGAGCLSHSRAVNARTWPLAGLDGQSALERLPSGPDARLLHHLLTMSQLAVARHPVNSARQRAGRLPLNSPWVWGVGNGQAVRRQPQEGAGGVFTTSPTVAGLGRAAGFGPATLVADEAALLDAAPLLAAVRRGPLLLHLQWPALLERHGLLPERREKLAALDRQLLAPLAAGLAGGAVPVVVVGGPASDGQGRGTVAPLLVVAAEGAQLGRAPRLWQRGRPGGGETLTGERFAARWLPHEG